VALLVALSPMAKAQTDPLLINRVKAGFLFNFARFTDWPPSALVHSAPLRIGVLGKPEVVSAIRTALTGKTVANHPVEVVAPATDEEWRSLHILYVTSSSHLDESELALRLTAPAVLTIGDAPDFAEKTGIIAFFERDGKLRFRINPMTAKRAGLQVSGQLASLAEVIRR